MKGLGDIFLYQKRVDTRGRFGGVFVRRRRLVTPMTCRG
jgi:hypothetical protein